MSNRRGRNRIEPATTKPKSTAKLTPRILKEIAMLSQDPVPGIGVTQDDSNARRFDVSLAGPPDSPFEGGTFKLELKLPNGYPFSPPSVHFNTKIYHPNISERGRICLDILSGKWSPALQIRTVLLSIQALLGDPNLDDPLNYTVAMLWKRNAKAAFKKAQEWTKIYAQPEK